MAAPNPPPLLWPSTPASVIVLNHLRTFHDPDPPPFFVRPSKLAAVIQIILFANREGGGEPQPPPLPLMPSMLHVLMVFILSIICQHQASYLLSCSLFFSSFSSSSFFHMFHQFHYCSLCHYVSSSVIVVHQFS